MRFIILFADNPGADPSLRQANMGAHLDFLEANAGVILEAGPLFTEAGAGDGGLWIVEAENAARAEALVRADPFWLTGLRHSHRVLAWTRVFAVGQRQV